LAAEIALLVLLAAFLHAGWNALVKASSDRLLIISAVAFAQFMAGTLIIPFVAAPHPASWPAIAWSTLFHYFYYACLYQAYRFGDLSQVYPLARGLAPLLVAIGAALFAREILSLPAIIGVGITSFGIASIAIFQKSSLRNNPSALFFAIGTGAIIAGYSVADGIGVRLSNSPFGYIAWLFFLEFPVVLFVLYRRRSRLLGQLQREWKLFAGTGTSSVCAYGIVIVAVNFAPMAAVSALRESSVIMAALFGTIFLGERPWQQRVAAAVFVAGGVAMITGGR
jgi:drug/metabolite transporter (DMT)-like permease